MTRTKFDRLWDDKVQAERLRQGREHAERKREIALARRALRDRFEPCPVLRTLHGTNSKRHFWHYMRPLLKTTGGMKSRREECIFCGATRPYIDIPGAFDAPNVGRAISATEIRDRYRDGNGGEWTIDGPMTYYPLPTKGVKGP